MRRKKPTPAAGGVPITIPQDILAKTLRIYTPEVTRQHMATVENLLIQGHTDAQIVQALMRSIEDGGLGLKKIRVRKVIDMVRNRFAEEDMASRPAWKSQQIRRITRMIRTCMGEKNEKGEWTVVPDKTNYARLESLLADIQGTREPLQVNIDISHKQAVLECFATMSPEELDSLYERGRQNEELAERARLLLPEVTVSRETVEGTAA